MIFDTFKQLTLAKVAERAEITAGWYNGVADYALDLIDSLDEMNFDPSKDYTIDELYKLMLNGANDWRQYSYGGSSLIYNDDIAKRLCTPSELERNHSSELPVAGYDSCLDMQAKALSQASGYVIRAYSSINSNKKAGA